MLSSQGANPFSQGVNPFKMSNSVKSTNGVSNKSNRGTSYFETLESQTIKAQVKPGNSLCMFTMLIIGLPTLI